MSKLVRCASPNQGRLVRCATGDGLVRCRPHEPCLRCEPPSSTPTRWGVTFTDTALCDCFSPTGEGGWNPEWWDEDLNDRLWLLEQSPGDACFWTGYGPILRMRYFGGDPSCTVGTGSANAQTSIYLRVYGTQITLRVGCTFGFAFKGIRSGLSDIDCSVSRSFTHQDYHYCYEWSYPAKHQGTAIAVPMS